MAALLSIRNPKSAFRNRLVTFPQNLWKSLWKKPFSALQVPDKFRLLAFCTSSRQSFPFLFQRPLKTWTLNDLHVATCARGGGARALFRSCCSATRSRSRAPLRVLSCPAAPGLRAVSPQTNSRARRPRKSRQRRRRLSTSTPPRAKSWSDCPASARGWPRASWNTASGTGRFAASNTSSSCAASARDASSRCAPSSPSTNSL